MFVVSIWIDIVPAPVLFPSHSTVNVSPPCNVNADKARLLTLPAARDTSVVYELK